MTNLEKVYAAVAKQHGITKALTEEIFKSQSTFVTDKMRENLITKEDRPIRLDFFGVFIVKPHRREMILKNKERAKQRKLEQNEEI